jgi:hypothetical protein
VVDGVVAVVNVVVDGVVVQTLTTETEQKWKHQSLSKLTFCIYAFRHCQQTQKHQTFSKLTFSIYSANVSTPSLSIQWRFSHSNHFSSEVLDRVLG